MLEIRRGIQHGGNFFAAQDGRQLSMDFRFSNLLNEPASLQGLRVEELERGIPNLKRVIGDN